MDDKTPTPDQTPDQTPASTPDAQTVPVAPAPPAAAPTADAGQHPTFPAAEPVATPAASAAKPGRKRALLIGGGIAAAVILAGGGIAVGAAIGDEFGDDDDRSSMSDGPRHDEGAPHGDRDDDRQDDDSAPSNGNGPVTGIGTASADELIEIADAARGAAEGEVTSIDAKRDGTWEVQLTAADGTETEVRVDESLAASVIETDPADGDDTGPALALDDATIRSLVDAALAEADGMITDLDVDGDDVSPYDASVLTSDNRSIDIDFDAAFAVVGTDVD
ncbi:MAG: hypothetical protein K0R99_664 [Microbacterium sp.]|jgi:uncharacterized membrane protein YkoI|uniref:hypothetical protein n=1 Tax=Microbacterium sp. TaxID=51671 RepID=UPI002604587F|nr:hypothetical protein [Microbacterium sp.]MDF2559218.1 hypothetical protein [Microbacterium sp.]